MGNCPITCDILVLTMLRLLQNKPGGGGWSWVVVGGDGAGWSWVHGLAIPRKISIKLKKLKNDFEDKTSFITKMSKSEFINSASKDENNWTEESETSDDEYFSDFAKLQS